MQGDRPRPDHRRRFGILASAALALLCPHAPADAEPHIGQFELKTLETAPRTYELQSQNAWSWNHPPRRVANGPDGLLLDENAAVRSRHALELEMGLTEILKMRIGVEFEKERLDDPDDLLRVNDFDDLELTEIGAEIIAVLAPRRGDGAGFGIVAEIERPLDDEESSSLILGPIFEFQSGRWFAAAIPMLVHAFGGDAEPGERVDDKWDFAYAVQIAYTFSESWKLAIEGYGTVERLGGSGNPSESALFFGDFDQHRLGPVLYYTRELGGSRRGGPGDSRSGVLAEGGEDDEAATLTIGLGLLEGLNGNTADHTLKLSIELDF